MKIMIVEDEAIVALSLRFALEEVGSYHHRSHRIEHRRFEIGCSSSARLGTYGHFAKERTRTDCACSSSPGKILDPVAVHNCAGQFGWGKRRRCPRTDDQAHHPIRS